MDATVREWVRKDRLENMLTEMRTGACPYVEVAESGFPPLVKGEKAFLLFPGLEELLSYHVFKDLSETDRVVDAMVTKFHKCGHLVDNALLKWRGTLESKLVKMVKDGREARRRKVPAVGVELVEGKACSTG
jgi:hypothetical protein